MRQAEAAQTLTKKGVNCILMWMQGGPSHIDTFDPKPEAPVEIRGEFQTIPTGQPGIRFVEHLPLLARQTDKFSIIRGHDPKNGSHGTADHLMMSGHKFNAALPFPCYGSVVAKERGYRDGMLPFVQLGKNIDRRFNGGIAGFLGDEFNAFEVREQYGRTTFGQSCLLARRLVESGVHFVTVTDGGWDTHQDNFKSLENRKLPVLDRAYAALLQDLHDRGLLDTTLVVWFGDFGREPKINPSAGRDHWASAGVACMGGGGVKTGQVVGATDALGSVVVDSPVTPQDLAATIYTALGVPLHTWYKAQDGRPIELVPEGKPVRQLLG